MARRLRPKGFKQLRPRLSEPGNIPGSALIASRKRIVSRLAELKRLPGDRKANIKLTEKALVDIDKKISKSKIKQGVKRRKR